MISPEREDMEEEGLMASLAAESGSAKPKLEGERSFRERPILMSAPMVRAILDGRKTQTRRIVKGVPSWDHYGRDIMDWDLSGIHQETYDPHDPIAGTDRWHLDVQTDVDDHSRRVIRCPYGAPNDLLWVKETWRTETDAYNDLSPADLSGEETILYDADGDWSLNKTTGRTRSSIHMPRWASRLSLRITDVRVERLAHISHDDCWAEGVVCDIHGERQHTACAGLTRGYRSVWEAINGPGSWDANPWVWVVVFERIQPDSEPQPRDQQLPADSSREDQ